MLGGGDGDGDSSGGSSGGGGATPLPVEIAALRGREVMQVASGGPHALALGGGDVFAWGAAAKGALGLQLAGAVLSVRRHGQSALVARSSPRGHPPLQKPTRFLRDAPWGPRGGPSPIWVPKREAAAPLWRLSNAADLAASGHPAVPPARAGPAAARVHLVRRGASRARARSGGNRVFAWGRNGSGELGLPQGECAALSAPRVVDGGVACSPPPPHLPGRTRARRLRLLRAALSGSGRLDTLRGRDWLTGQSASASGAHASRLQSRRFRRLWPFRRRARSWGDNQRRRAGAAAGGRERRRPLLAGVGAQPSVSGWVGRVCARAAQPGSGPRREHGRGRGRRGRQWRGRRRAVVAAVAGTAGQ